MSFKSLNLVKISISGEFSKFIAFFMSGSLTLKKIFPLISSAIVDGIVGFLFFKLSLISFFFFFKKSLFGLNFKQNSKFLKVYSWPQ